jgi:REP element-mobilizing transposase RayT
MVRVRARLGIASLWARDQNHCAKISGSYLSERELRRAAKRSLVRSPVEFTGLQCRAIGMGFFNCCQRTGCKIYACSILPTHTHLVVGRMAYHIEQLANLLKGAATTELWRQGLHPFAGEAYRNGRLPTPWARNQWSCFLDSHDDIRRSIDYVEYNPIKDQKRAQNWSCVTPFA